MTDIEYAETIIERLVYSRSEYLKIHSDFLKVYPDWTINKDARSNLIAKPINLLLVPIVSLKSFQDTTVNVNYWNSRVSSEFYSSETIMPSIKEIDIFNRYALFQFLLSSFEHGFRAIHASIIDQNLAYSQKPFKKIYEELFNEILEKEDRQTQIDLFNYFRLLRNTIHNNGCFYPYDKKDVICKINEYSLTLEVGKNLEYFGWEHLVQYIDLLKGTLEKIMSSPKIYTIPFISDICTMKD